MSGQEVAALVVAVTGAIAAIFAGIRNLRSDRFKKEVEASSALLSGQLGFAGVLQLDIDRLRSDHAEDRAAWAAERQEHRDEIARLRAEHRAELALAYERLEEIGSQIYALQHRPPETRDRRGDRK